MQRGHPLRVLEVHVSAVAKEPFRRREVAPLDGAEKGRLVLGDGIHARPVLDEQVDRVHVVVERGGPQAVFRSRSLLQEQLRQGQVAAPRDGVPERGGLEGPLHEGGLIDVEAEAEEVLSQPQRPLPALVGAGQAAQEMQRVPSPLVLRPLQIGVGLEKRGGRFPIQRLDGLKEPRLAHGLTLHRARRPIEGRPAPHRRRTHGPEDGPRRR